MLGAVVHTAFAGSGGEFPFDLAGEWKPCRKGQWKNNVAWGHAARARAAHTRLNFRPDGSGTAVIGELKGLSYKVTCVAAGQYTGSAKWGLGLGWSASDGNYTLEQCGTLKVEFPSSGVTEYWERTDGQGSAIYARAHAKAAAKAVRKDVWKAVTTGATATRRPIKLVMRHFGPGDPLGSSRDLFYHWGLAVGDESACYEVAGSMVIIGPSGCVAASSLLGSTKRTALSQFDAYLTLSQTTTKTNGEVEDFSRRWVKRHPTYHITGPNCQTYAEDLFTFCTGENLPFDMSSERMRKGGRGYGPEKHPNVVWLKNKNKAEVEAAAGNCSGSTPASGGGGNAASGGGGNAPSGGAVVAVVVEGAGTAACNGRYLPEGNHRFRKVGGQQTINRGGAGRWRFRENYGSDVYYGHQTPGLDAPPAEGWAVIRPDVGKSIGTNPPPALRLEFANAHSGGDRNERMPMERMHVGGLPQNVTVTNLSGVWNTMKHTTKERMPGMEFELRHEGDRIYRIMPPGGPRKDDEYLYLVDGKTVTTRAADGALLMARHSTNNDVVAHLMPDGEICWMGEARGNVMGYSRREAAAAPPAQPSECGAEAAAEVARRARREADDARRAVEEEKARQKVAEAGRARLAAEAPPMTLGARVAILKRELELSGTMAEIVHAAADQLGVESSGSLMDKAAACVEAIGVGQ